MPNCVRIRAIATDVARPSVAIVARLSRFRGGGLWLARQSIRPRGDGVGGLLAAFGSLPSRIAAEASRGHDLPGGSARGTADDVGRPERQLPRLTVPGILREPGAVRQRKRLEPRSLVEMTRHLTQHAKPLQRKEPRRLIEEPSTDYFNRIDQSRLSS